MAMKEQVENTESESVGQLEQVKQFCLDHKEEICIGVGLFIFGALSSYAVKAKIDNDKLMSENEDMNLKNIEQEQQIEDLGDLLIQKSEDYRTLASDGLRHHSSYAGRAMSCLGNDLF